MHRRMIKKPSRTLSLTLDTIRSLTARELSTAGGGISAALCNLSKHCGGSGSIGSASGAANCAWSTGVEC